MAINFVTEELPHNQPIRAEVVIDHDDDLVLRLNVGALAIDVLFIDSSNGTVCALSLDPHEAEALQQVGFVVRTPGDDPRLSILR